MTGNLVLASFENVDRSCCVDIFQRADGTYGFEEYREDVDGGARWQSLARYSTLVFESGAAALAAASRRVVWLGDVGPWRW